jgi:hypothetical protein
VSLLATAADGGAAYADAPAGGHPVRLELPLTGSLAGTVTGFRDVREVGVVAGIPGIVARRG